MQLFDIRGRQLVTTRNTASINVAELPRGTYLLRLENRGLTETIRFVR